MRQAREAQSSRTEPWEGGGEHRPGRGRGDDDALCHARHCRAAALRRRVKDQVVVVTDIRERHERPVHKGVHFANLDVGGSGSCVEGIAGQGRRWGMTHWKQ